MDVKQKYLQRARKLAVAQLQDHRSKQIQRKVGNTNQPSAKKHFILTLKVSESWNSSNSSILNSWLRQHCSAYAWQLECGTMTGYYHIQLTLTLFEKQRFTWLKRHFCSHAHIEECHNIDASFDYCSKSDTRIRGPYIYPEPIDSQIPIQDPLEGVEYYWWQKRLLEILDNPVHPRHIHYFFDTTGNTGKSTMALHCILKYNAIVYDGQTKDIMHAHTNARVVIFDIPRSSGNVSWHAVESLKRGFGFSPKYDSKMKLFQIPHIIIFSNDPPDISKLSLDRWQIYEITTEYGHYSIHSPQYVLDNL